MHQTHTALKLAKLYSSSTIPYLGYPFPVNKDGKWWKYFLNLSERIDEVKADPYIFITSQFQERGMIYPTQLNTKEAWEIYKGFESKKGTNHELGLAKMLLATINIVKEWSSIHGFNGASYSNFLKDDKNKFLLKRHNINPELFLFTKSFYTELTQEERNEIIPAADTRRMVIHSYKKIIKKLKEVLQDEFNGDISED